MARVSRAALATAVKARLSELVDVTVYVGGVTGKPPTLSPDDPRVRPYVVLYPSPGVRTEDGDIAETTVDLDWTFQVTCVTGDPDALPELLDDVDALLDRWTPPVAGLAVSQVAQVGNPGPNRRDESELPPRHFNTPTYGLRATT